ncbi:MAG: shikimate dehydrogenase [Novosphingobium sp.]|nr:shikimate dehydrogenase [Novosphingobium sp.]
MSRPYAEVIGDPIAHSKSPLIHNFWLERLGIDAKYRTYHIRPDELEGYFAERRVDPDWRGCNVTVPHKQTVIPWLDEVDAKAESVGAVNTILRGLNGSLTGTNTDVDGIGEVVAGASLVGRAVVVLGSGGAARAAFAFLADSACKLVRVVARSPDKAAKAAKVCGLQAEIVSLANGDSALEGASLLVNATQLGMTGQQAMAESLLGALGGLASDALVFDMVYAPLETELLKQARMAGLATSDGLVMLIGQAATAFERFFGTAAPRRCDKELRGILTA